MLLNHQAGDGRRPSGVRWSWRTCTAGRRLTMTEALAEHLNEPWWTPGERHGSTYHALTYGWLLVGD